MGKAIILNTLTLAKTAYLSNVFPIPREILTQIHKQIFHYIWSKNQELIARKTLFLPKNKGGITIKEPEVHNLAMRTKHLLNLKYKKIQPRWTHLATYWLAKDIHKFGKENNHLRSNNRVKTINQKPPLYYNDLINYIKTQNPNLPKIEAYTILLYEHPSRRLKI